MEGMRFLRRRFVQFTVASATLPKLAVARVPEIGAVPFCRVSHPRFLRIARTLYPDCIATCEPRAGFRGITVCGAQRTFTLSL